MPLLTHASHQEIGRLWLDWTADIARGVCFQCSRANWVMTLDGEDIGEDLVSVVHLCRRCYVEWHAELCGCPAWAAEQEAVRAMSAETRLAG